MDQGPAPGRARRVVGRQRRIAPLLIAQPGWRERPGRAWLFGCGTLRPVWQFGFGFISLANVAARHARRSLAPLPPCAPDIVLDRLVGKDRFQPRIPAVFVRPVPRIARPQRSADEQRLLRPRHGDIE